MLQSHLERLTCKYMRSIDSSCGAIYRPNLPNISIAYERLRHAKILETQIPEFSKKSGIRPQGICPQQMTTAIVRV